MMLSHRMALVLTALLLSTPRHLVADDWPGPVVKEVFSENRQHFVRVVPGESIGETVGFRGAKVGKHAKAEFYRREADRSYRLEREIELPNPVAPVDFFVSNAGDLVTLDNWHNVGYGIALALYRQNGQLLVKAYPLSDLFSKCEIEEFPESVSSIWWHKGPMYISESQRTFYMGYRDAPDYRELILSLQDGSVRLCATVEGKYRCRNVGSLAPSPPRP
jgi:hypothetical protein